MSEPTRQRGDQHWTRRAPEMRVPWAKISDKRIAAMCQEYAQNSPPKTWLAKKYGVSRTSIWRYLRARGLI